MAKIKKAAVLGASGYTGIEIIRLIQNHPHIEIAALTGHSRAGETASEVFGSLSSFDLPPLQNWKNVDWASIDVAFACLPHGASQETIAEIRPHVDVVVDLSADFRLRDPLLYEAVYNAGRKSTLGLSYTELAEGAQAYGVGHHRHAPEIDHIIKSVTGMETTVSMTPHLVPMNRGMITTTIVSLKKGKTWQDLRASMLSKYAESAFITVLDEGIVPQTRHVRASNHCHMNVFDNRVQGTATVIAVIDNLTKGL